MRIKQVIINKGLLGEHAIIRVSISYVSLEAVRSRIVNNLGTFANPSGVKIYQKGINIVADIPQGSCHGTGFGAVIVSLAVLERTNHE